MNKDRLGAIIVTVLLVLSISSPIASAVSVNYEADSDGDYIYINENYEIDNTVTVTETTDIYFGGNLHVDQERTAEGTGKTDLEQTITGKPMKGAGYVAENDIESDGTIDAQTSISATANTLGLDQEVFATGYTDLHLEGEKADNKAGHDAGVYSGMLRSKQTLVIENSVRTSLDTSIRGISGRASSWAEDADENKASTFVRVDRGRINTKQKSEADGSATASKDLTASGHGIHMGCDASNAEGDHASMHASVDLGAIAAFDAAKAIKKKATTTDNLAAIGRGIQKGTRANNAEGDYAGAYASVDAGILASSENAEAVIDKATASEVLAATGSGIRKGSYARNEEGDYARTRASVDRGFLVSYDEAEAVIDKATASEVLAATGSGIRKGSYARNEEGDYASTTASVDRGFLVSYDEAEAIIDKATASEVVAANGSGIRKGSYARNEEGDYASTTASVDRGFLVSYDEAEAVIDKATASEVLAANGSGIRKGSYARNEEGDYASTGASVDRGFLVSYDEAEAVIDKATASEVLAATGSGIRKGSYARNEEGDYASTGASVDRGFLVSYDEAEAVIDKATASEVLAATGSGIRKGSYARNEEGDYASTTASVDRGFLVSYDEAEAVIDKATASEVLAATGSGIRKGSRAWDAEGDYADTEASVASGLVVSYDNAEAVIDKATASELLTAAGSGIEKGSYAENAEGDYARTGASVDNGFLVSYDNAEAIIDKATASELLTAAGSGIYKGSRAWDAEGDYARTEASVASGLVVSYDNAEAVIDKATASELLTAAGSGIYKGSYAQNAGGDYAGTRASVDNGFLVSYDNAEAVIDKATASELLTATGSGIEKGSYAGNAEGDFARTYALVDNGFLVSYDNAEAVIDKATASELLTAAGSGILKGSKARNAEGDYARTEASVNSGLVVSYDNAEAVIDKATASEVLAATGSGILKGSQAQNAGGDYAGTRASVDNGFVVSYDNAEAVIDKATASELLTATGSGIWKGSKARNAEGDYARTEASVASGLVVSYDEAEAVIGKATASEDLIVVGTEIYGSSYAENAEGETAATRTLVGNGMMMSFDDAEATKHKTVVSTGTIASGDWIDKVSNTENGRGDTAGTAIRVDGDAFMATYDDVSATNIQTSVTTVSTASGDKIAKVTVARTPEGDMAGTSLYVDEDAFMATYDDASATNIQTSVTTASIASGNKIAKDTQTETEEGDTAGTSLYIDEDAFMATLDAVSASNTQTSVITASTASGDEIAKNTETKTEEGDTAGTSLYIDEDAFMATLDAVSASNTQTSVITASTASGDEIAKNTETKTEEGDTAGTSLYIDEDAFMATLDAVSASNTQTSVITASTASGDEIAKNTETKTEEGDMAGTSLYIDEDAFMATLDAVSASNTQTSVITASTASGDEIAKNTETKTEEGDTAGTSLYIDEDAFMATLDAVSASNTQTSVITASTASGDEIAKNTETKTEEGDTAGTSLYIDEDAFMATLDAVSASNTQTSVITASTASGDEIAKNTETKTEEGDMAGTSLYIDEDAFMATLDAVSASNTQTSVITASTASGDEIAKNTETKTEEGDMAGTSLYIDEDAFMATLDAVSASNTQTSVITAAIASGDEIAKNTETKTEEGDMASTSLSVDEDTLMATFNAVSASNTQTAVITAAIAKGDEIEKDTETKTAGGDMASTSLSVDEDALMATLDAVSASNTETAVITAAIAKGDEIEKDTETKTAGGDMASTSLSVDEDALMATLDAVSATNTETAVITAAIAKGDEIEKDTETKTAGGNMASTSLSVDEDALMATLDAAFATNTQTLVATASAASGGKINTGGGSATNSRGDSSTYASVEDGTLLIFRAAIPIEEMTVAMLITKAEGDLIKAGGISNSPIGWARSDVTVSNGDLTAGIVTAQMPLPEDFEIFDITGPVFGFFSAEAELKSGDIAATGTYMQADGSVTATAEGNNIHKSGTDYDVYTGSGPVTKLPVAGILRAVIEVTTSSFWGLIEDTETKTIDVQEADGILP